MKLRCVVTALLLIFSVGATGAAAGTTVSDTSAVAAKSPIIKNAPFSADVITEYDRVLENGGHIHRESRGRICRDSAGRIRTEDQLSPVQFGTEKSDHITINDPVQQVIIYLYPKNKTAAIFHFGDTTSQSPTLATKSSKPKDKSTIRVGGQPGVTGGPVDTLGVPSIPAGQGNASANSSIPSVNNAGSKTENGLSASAGATVVPLGTKTIEGVTAVGTRTTRIISPGTIGNDRAIVSICNTWVSSELKVAVLSETDDGQSGHSTTKLVNIVRSDPGAALFQIPADYKVKENMSTASVKR